MVSGLSFAPRRGNQGWAGHRSSMPSFAHPLTYMKGDPLLAVHGEASSPAVWDMCWLTACRADGAAGGATPSVLLSPAGDLEVSRTETPQRFEMGVSNVGVLGVRIVADSWGGHAASVCLIRWFDDIYISMVVPKRWLHRKCRIHSRRKTAGFSPRI